MESACGVYSIMERASEARDDFQPFGVCVDRPDGSREFLNWEREKTAELGDLHALGLAEVYDLPPEEVRKGQGLALGVLKVVEAGPTAFLRRENARLRCSGEAEVGGREINPTRGSGGGACGHVVEVSSLVHKKFRPYQ